MKNWLPRIVAKAPAPVLYKLMGAFFAIVALFIIFGVIGLQVLSGIDRRSEEISRLQRKVAMLRQFQHDMITRLYSVTAALLSPDERQIESELRDLHKFRLDIKGVPSVAQDEIEHIKRIVKEEEQLIEVIEDIAILIRGLEFTKAIELRNTKLVSLAESFEQLVNDMIRRAETEMEIKIGESRKDYLKSRWLVIGFAAASIGLAILLGYAVSSSLMGPVMLMDKRLSRIASGDFSGHVSVANRDELGTLAENLNRMNDELKSLYQQIESASRHKSDFLASMSHELRTPLNAIIGYSEMLMEDAEDLNQKSFIPDLQKIRTSGRHLLALINDILDLCKIEAGKIVLSPETFDILGLIREVVSTVKPLAEKNSNFLEINFDDNLGTMYADITRVRQMLFNLLSNACKFTEQGTITIEAARDVTEAAEWLSIRIRDTGIGITREQMERLFQPFSQADIQTSRKYGGTGLGLSITRQFCEMMGGEITAKSEFGRGTTFTVRLPLAKGDADSVVMSQAKAGRATG